MNDIFNQMLQEHDLSTVDGQTKLEVQFFNLDMIISVGYRVHSHRGVQFRMWATSVLKEYLQKGFAINDELLKNAGGGRARKVPIKGSILTFSG